MKVSPGNLVGHCLLLTLAAGCLWWGSCWPFTDPWYHPTSFYPRDRGWTALPDAT